MIIPTNLSSKGQLTIPKAFRQRMGLTGRQRVSMDQLPDGTVVIRPAESILKLAGKLTLKRSLLPPAQERRETHQKIARQGNNKGRKK